VEEIRDKRRGDDGDWLYYVKWVGWDSDTNTWEPVEHLAEDSKEKLDDFERRWKKRQERKEEKRMEEKKRRKEERRQKELKAAARFSLKHDSDGEGAPVDFKDFNREKNRVKKVSDSESDSDGERDKRREREREERRKKKSPLDMMMEKKRENEGGMKDRGRDKDKKEDRKPKYYRDIKPVKILGVTTEPGDLHFYVEWDSGMEPGLVPKKEAYKKIPDMCLAYYESKLIWRDAPPKAVKEEAEISNGVNKVNLGETKSEEGIKTEDTEKTKVLENGGGGGDAPRAPTPVLHSYS